MIKNYQKEIWNKRKTGFVIITRRKFPDGKFYYYLMKLSRAITGSGFVWNETYKQKEDITSEKQAIIIAKKWNETDKQRDIEFPDKWLKNAGYKH